MRFSCHYYEMQVHILLWRLLPAVCDRDKSTKKTDKCLLFRLRIAHGQSQGQNASSDTEKSRQLYV